MTSAGTNATLANDSSKTTKRPGGKVAPQTEGSGSGGAHKVARKSEVLLRLRIPTGALKEAAAAMSPRGQEMLRKAVERAHGPTDEQGRQAVTKRSVKKPTPVSAPKTRTSRSSAR